MKSQPSTTEQEPSETDTSTFAFAVTRIASAQICQSVGFTSARRSALDTLTNVAARYLRALARSAAAASSSSGRTQSNLLDVVRALEDLASVHGFSGAWDPSRRPLASATLADLSSFVERTDEIPFAKPLPRPPSPERAVFTAKWTGVLHVPRWLPAFPEMGEREIGGEERVKEEERSGVVVSFGKVDGGFLGDEKMKMGLLEKRGRVRS
ncbi:hypothetical protein RHSIM_Rhsim03G0155300 [Rhododendron simsii]|uniref:Bromodomain associated domain-containing protein n=1 Tax=Rhododendron simsii TaxID=118357 RepID=A0A834H7H2_RHOSS|nr:hypothetical protein RHSIM_Rhsim03G0155300 [Rhododendron simsii]